MDIINKLTDEQKQNTYAAAKAKFNDDKLIIDFLYDLHMAYEEVDPEITHDVKMYIDIANRVISNIGYPYNKDVKLITYKEHSSDVNKHYILKYRNMFITLSNRRISAGSHPTADELDCLIVNITKIIRLNNSMINNKIKKCSLCNRKFENEGHSVCYYASHSNYNYHFKCTNCTVNDKLSNLGLDLCTLKGCCNNILEEYDFPKLVIEKFPEEKIKQYMEYVEFQVNNEVMKSIHFSRPKASRNR